MLLSQPKVLHLLEAFIFKMGAQAKVWKQTNHGGTPSCSGQWECGVVWGWGLGKRMEFGGGWLQSWSLWAGKSSPSHLPCLYTCATRGYSETRVRLKPYSRQAAPPVILALGLVTFGIGLWLWRQSGFCYGYIPQTIPVGPGRICSINIQRDKLTLSLPHRHRTLNPIHDREAREI